MTNAEPGAGFSLARCARLRAYALGVACGRAEEAVPEASAASWRVFLRAEACALLLHQRMGSALGALPPEAAADLRALAMGGEQRRLAARAQAAGLAAWAERASVRVVVLKGGVAAVTGTPPVGMADLDVLVPEEAAPSLAAWLEGEGHWRDAGLADRGRGHHLGQRTPPGGIPVEVHRFLKGMPAPRLLIDRSRPLGPGVLRRLAPADHLWYLLVHSTLLHPDRRGSIRDLLLLAVAWSECTAGEREGVLRQARESPAAPMLVALLEMAAGAAAGEVVEDRFARESAARCVLRHRAGPLPLSRRFRGDLFRATFALLGPAGDYRECWARLVSDRPRPAAPARTLAFLPRLAWRAGRLGVASAFGAAAAAAAARGARKVGAGAPAPGA